jgi:hypothetical protein
MGSHMSYIDGSGYNTAVPGGKKANGKGVHYSTLKRGGMREKRLVIATTRPVDILTQLPR